MWQVHSLKKKEYLLLWIIMGIHEMLNSSRLMISTEYTLATFIVYFSLALLILFCFLPHFILFLYFIIDKGSTGPCPMSRSYEEV